MQCHTCLKLVHESAFKDIKKPKCPRCNSHIEMRKKHSLQSALSYVITATVFFIPANMLPIMTIQLLGDGDPSTIIESVFFLLDHGQYPIAFIIFIASFFIPLVKILGILFILYSLKYRESIRKHQLSFLLNMVEVLGKWSMLDIFVVAILFALVQFGIVGSVIVEEGATYFALMVIFTMFGAHAIDPKLIWDKVNGQR